MIGEGFAAALAAAQEGSEAAFSQLWRDGNPALLRYLRVIAPESAEDVAGDTWLQVVRGLAGFRGDEQAWRAWLFTIARRRTIDEGRRRARRGAAPPGGGPGAQLPTMPDAADPARAALANPSGLGPPTQLPPPPAAVGFVWVVGGAGTEAVSELVGRSPGAVRVAAHRGLKRLAEILAEAGVTL